jgi:hypothetical protein
MKQLVYSYFIANDNGNYSPGAVETMLNLWTRSLRETGKFRGDILVFTDRPELRIPHIIAHPLLLPKAELKHFWLTRILNYKNLPYRDYDTLMHIDLDAVCVNDINDLFALNEEMRAAPSNLLLFDRQHILQFLNPVQRIWYRCFSAQKRRNGVSACVFSCASSAWEKNMGAWAEAIEQHMNGHAPDLGDQSFLNLLYFRRTIPIKPYLREEIQHKDWSFSPQARIFHFPGLADRAALMHHYYSLYGNAKNPGLTGSGAIPIAGIMTPLPSKAVN